MAIQAPSSHNIVQCVKFVCPRANVSVPSYGNNHSNFRQWGSLTVNITPKFANSHIRIIQHGLCQNVHSHFYMSWKRGGTGGTWLDLDTSAGGDSNADGIFANHNGTTSDYWSSMLIWEDSDPGYNLGDTITYVPYVGMWSGITLNLNTYANNGNAELPQGTHGYLEEIAYT